MTLNVSVAIQVDHESDTGYIRLRKERVDRTLELTNLVLVDVDSYNVATGLEVLSLDAEIPFSRLQKEFHVPSSTVALLRAIQPTLGNFLNNVTTGADSTHDVEASPQRGRRRALATA